MAVFLEANSLWKVTINLLGLIEMETVVVFFHMSARIYQLKLSIHFTISESFYFEISLHKKKWLLNCSYNPHKNKSVIIWTLLPKHKIEYYSKCKNVVFLGDFNAGTEEIPLNFFANLIISLAW